MSAYSSTHRPHSLTWILLPAALLLAIFAIEAVAAPSRLSASFSLSLPSLRQASVDFTATWDHSSVCVAASAPLRDSVDVAVTSFFSIGSVRLTASAEQLLTSPLLSSGVSIGAGGLRIAAESLLGFGEADGTALSHRLRFAVSPTSGLDLTATLWAAQAQLLDASVSVQARTDVAEFSYLGEWTPYEMRQATYTLDVPAIALGVTRVVYSGNGAAWTTQSVHAVSKELSTRQLPEGPQLPVTVAQLASARYAQAFSSTCSACSTAIPLAQDDHTIEFGEVMVGNSASSGLILNCPYSTFCWLDSILSSPHSPFSVLYAPIGMTIPAGSERRLELGFGPSGAGVFRDSITIRYCVAYWVEEEEELAAVIGDVSGYYTYRCSQYTFPMTGTALAKPEAVATYAPRNPICGKDVQFDGSGSYDPNPEGAIQAYVWDFGDGTTASGSRPTHRYAAAGTYRVSLVVTNNREMASDPYVVDVQISPDLLETAATVGAAAAAGWATHALSMAAPVLAAAVPGAVLAVSSVIADLGAVAYPIDQLVVRFPESWDLQDIQELITRSIPGVRIIGSFSTLGASLIQLPLSTDDPESAAEEVERMQTILDRILPPGSQLAKNYIGRFEGVQDQYAIATCDIDAIDAEFRMAYEAVRAPSAWQRLSEWTGKLHPVRVAVIDSGIEASHDEFLIPLRGRSYVVSEEGSQPWYEDGSGHGTQISGIIGAENGQGRMNGMLSGIAGSYEMQVYRVIGDMFSVWDCLRIAVSRSEEELQAIATAVEVGTSRKAVVTNISVGWNLDGLPEGEKILARNTFRDIFEQYPNTLFVTSAGNGNRPEDLENSVGVSIGTGQLVHAPGGLMADNNLTVAATNASGTELAEWSNYGAAVDIAAPGVNVYTTDRDGGYVWRVEGTSYAAALVSGAAAAVRSIDPRLTPAEVKDILTSSPTCIRAPDDTFIPVLDYPDAIRRAMEARTDRNRRMLWWAAGTGLGVLAAGLLLLRPF